MTDAPKRYLFNTAAQWRAGLVTGGTVGASGLTTATRLAATPVLVWPGDAYAPAALATGEVYWRDAAGVLHWLTDADQPAACDTAADPTALGGALRLIATDRLLWAIAAGVTAVGACDRHTLQPVADIDLSGTILDIAWAERRAVAALVTTPGGIGLTRIDEHRRTGRIAIPPLDHRTFQIAATAGCWVVAEPSRLRWAPVDDPSAGWADLPLTALGNGTPLTATLLAAFPPDRVVLVCSAGTDQRLVILGQHGEVLAEAAIPAAVGTLHGIAAAAASLWLACSTGLWHWDVAPDLGTGVACFVTPMLRSPLGRDSGWLRAEIEAIVPPGATISCQIASTQAAPPAKVDLVNPAQAIFADSGLTSAAKLASLDTLLPWGPPVQIATGTDAPGAGAASTDPSLWVLPLQATTDEFLWLKLQLTDGAGNGTPLVSSLAVLYPELSLMQRLPAIYRAAPSTHLRGLVALLDIMAQGLDHRIGTLGQFIDPGTTPDDWLNYLASWLGLPWEDGLPIAARRGLLRAAPDLLAERGTAAGIRRLVGVLLPGRTVTLSDAASFLPAILGQPGEGGSGSPPILLGRKQDATRLNVAVLGRTRLRPCEPADDPLLRLSGWVRIEISATPAERTALAGPLGRLLAGYVPAGLTVEVRWQAWPSAAGRRLDQDLTLQGDRPGLLGQDIRLGGITLSGGPPSLRRGLDLSDNERLL